MTAIRMEVSTSEIIRAVKEMNEKERQDFIEELLAATSPDYLASVEEAREDYQQGRIKSHEDIFGT